jgi:AcrR family transcriptional regulator
MATLTRTPTRDRILDVADRLFYAQGIRAVGIDTIVAESGAAKTTLYSHFGSKDELVAAYLRRRSEHWRAHLDAELDAHPGPPAERVLHVFDLLGAWFSDPDYRGCPFINACAEFADPDHPAAVVIREHRQRLQATITSLCAAAGARDPDLLAAQLVLLYDGAMITANIEGTPTVARTAKAAAATLLHENGGQAIR